MELAEQMTNVINFPDMTSSNVRVPPFLKLSEIVDYVKKVLWDDNQVSNTEVKHTVFCNNDKFFNEAVNLHQTPMTTEN
ncbi:unnamed protein product [Schistosoma mattheei]|uniref:Uncharacterized protein n=1 Tax=Schistosoma mattheei TaxID=31246 RepID=A0A183NL20_9TREM|nr:unnamed protein product [Schistosoma mattheei]